MQKIKIFFYSYSKYRYIMFESIVSIGKGKKFVLVDGVGYASVGSCCGVSNGQVTSLFFLFCW